MSKARAVAAMQGLRGWGAEWVRLWERRWPGIRAFFVGFFH